MTVTAWAPKKCLDFPFHKYFTGNWITKYLS